MTKETNKGKSPDLGKWDDFSGDYLKTDIVTKFPVELVPVKIEASFDEKTNKPRMNVTVHYNDKDWIMELNKTNQKVIRAKGLMPKEVVGRKLIFDKIKVRNPSNDTMVDSFVLTDIA